jgi:hypothetical protein
MFVLHVGLHDSHNTAYFLAADPWRTEVVGLPIELPFLPSS